MADAPRRDGTPPASSELTRRRMQNTPVRDTPAELALRSALHALGLRFRVDRAPLPELHRRADVVFGPSKVAVFVDGCFWHYCPEHGSIPKTNSEWWRAKLARTQQRDADTDRRLVEAGWLPIRVWEHDDPRTAAERIAASVAHRRPSRAKLRGEKTSASTKRDKGTK